MKKLLNHLTAVELLIVICISCIIATIMLPAFYKSVARSRLKACSSNLRKLGSAVIFYSSDNCGMIPNIMPGLETSSIAILRLPNNHVLALGRLLIGGYLSDPEVFGCPDSPGFDGSSVRANWKRADNMVWSGYLYRSQDQNFNVCLNSPENFNRAFLMDFACRTPAGAQFAPHDYNYTNLLYNDNHVVCRENSPEPFKLYTASTARHGEITPDCKLLWQRSDRSADTGEL